MRSLRSDGERGRMDAAATIPTARRSDHWLTTLEIE